MVENCPAEWDKYPLGKKEGVEMHEEMDSLSIMNHQRPLFKYIRKQV